MTRHTFTRFDAADYLNSDEAIAEFLNATIEENADDPSAILQALETVIRARNVSQVARDAGLSRKGVYKAFSEEGNPSFATVLNVGRALGLRISFTPTDEAA